MKTSLCYEYSKCLDKNFLETTLTLKILFRQDSFVCSNQFEIDRVGSNGAIISLQICSAMSSLLSRVNQNKNRTFENV